MQRCGWVSQDPLYIEYHDTEWGVAQKEGRQLFEMICLEGQQAGLSWITVLKKRQNYRQAFHQFDPVRVAAMGDDDIERLLQDTGIIRHRGKIQAIIGNAAPIWRWKKMASRSLILSGPSSTMRHR
ncbi:3-methyl-adenine DNA glycosylase I [Klebsiella pneumoniae]|nr:3-methyl-adenine DNA glycosylase I [Klebsiella pneumoniae]